MDEIAENCTSLAIFSQGGVLASGKTSTLFNTDSLMVKAGLDIPFTAKLCKLLSQNGIVLSCNFTMDDFVQKTLDLYHSVGAGMRLSIEGGGADA